MIKWIETKQRLPETDRKVLVAFPFCDNPFTRQEGQGAWLLYLASFTPQRGWEIDDWDGDFTIIYWLDIPEIPTSTILDKTS